MEGNLITIALVGPPDSGKDTIFYGLCKASFSGDKASPFPAARGTYRCQDQGYLLLNLPETYSLSPRAPVSSAFGARRESFTEQVLSSGRADIILLTCSAFSLERGLKLLSQLINRPSIREQSTPVVLCINFCDEAEAKGIHIDFDLLEDVLQLPVLPCYAFSSTDLDDIKTAVSHVWKRLFSYECLDFSPKKLAAESTFCQKISGPSFGEKIDDLLSDPISRTCFGLLLFLLLFWLTVIGARSPSLILWKAFFWLERRMAAVLLALRAPNWFIDCFVYHIYGILAWVISIMLPPAVIFFFLYIFLDNLGILPRIAFWLDPLFARCRSCGQHGVCLGLGVNCHAAQIICCRRITSPRERMQAVLTAPLLPCAGRFPAFFTMASFFFVAETGKGFAGGFRMILYFSLIFLSALGVCLGTGALLSCLLLRNFPSMETIALPVLHKPQLRKAIIPAVLDHSLFLLGKAAASAVPAGLLLWIAANTLYHGESLLVHFARILNPLGMLMGLDGIILISFILGFFGKEIILPVLFMLYLQTGNIMELPSFLALKQLLFSQGWTGKTALSMTILMLFHWPCRTALSCIKKETLSWKWTLVSFLLPTLIGTGLCMLITGAGQLIR